MTNNPLKHNSGKRINLIFDIGNVICEWDPDRLVRRIFPDPVQQQEALTSIIGHGDWKELDRGTISLEQAIANAVKRCSIEKEKIETLFTQTPASLLPIQGTLAAIHDLNDRGLSLYVLSNIQKHSWEYLTANYDFWSVFRGIVVSYQVNMIKPEQELYEYITARYDLPPAETLFLDDMSANIIAARAHGLNTIHFVNTEDSLKELYRTVEVMEEQ